MNNQNIPLTTDTKPMVGTPHIWKKRELVVIDLRNLNGFFAKAYPDGTLYQVQEETAQAILNDAPLDAIEDGRLIAIALGSSDEASVEQAYRNSINVINANIERGGCDFHDTIPKVAVKRAFEILTVILRIELFNKDESLIDATSLLVVWRACCVPTTYTVEVLPFNHQHLPLLHNSSIYTI